MTDQDREDAVCRQMDAELDETVDEAPAPAPLPALSREQILGADDLLTQVVFVPEWGGTVNLRVMSAAERDRWEGDMLALKERGPVAMGAAGIRARFVAQLIVDAAGQRMFSDTDVEALGRKSACALQRLFEAGMKLNGLRTEDVEELEGN